MNLRHIEIFHAVFVNGSVSAAARMLNVSQPSVTKVLRHAEQQLGFALFERTRGRLVATPEAHALFGEVSEIQERVHQLHRSSRSLRQGQASIIKISALPSLGLRVLPDAVAEFLTLHRDVSFDLHTVHTDDMVRKLYEREVDIIVSFEVPRAAPVASRVLGSGELLALYREVDWPQAPLRIGLELLQERPFVNTTTSGPQGRMLSNELTRRDLVLNDVASSQTFFVAAALVRAGAGMTIVDSFTAQAAMTPGLATRPLDPPLRFDVFAVYLENRPPSRRALAFLKHLSRKLQTP
uniref:LysR family transcriptional regulator n=1 Tax=uncultured Sphingomonas sp. TaxID=158754 RepID=UPI0035CA8CDA